MIDLSRSLPVCRIEWALVAELVQVLHFASFCVDLFLLRDRFKNQGPLVIDMRRFHYCKLIVRS